jgi:origin recognition complex subunit 4
MNGSAKRKSVAEDATDHDRIGRSHVLAKLNQRVTSPLIHLDSELRDIEAMLESTIVSREGNSCLMIGPRSTGKTTLIETAIKSLDDKYPRQFITIRLSGFAQTDDRMALREITRQLDAFISKESEDYESLEKKAISETLQSLLSVFETANDNSVSVIFILDELDRFAMHTRQTLLYNLLDLSQTTQVGIAVVGITARMNTRELLEKRVRSRFSQRIYSITRSATLQGFWEICRATVTIDEGIIDQDFRTKWNDHIEVSILTPGRFL